MLPLVKVRMPPRNELMPRLEKVLYGGFIAEGDDVYEFERSFSSKFELSNCLATSSGTAALHMALKLAGVKEGDEVISTPMTAEPTNIAIFQAGGIPIFADVDPCSGNICPNSVEEKITNKTKVILVVHYAGYPADMDSIMKVAREHKIKVVEDCAHALGAAVNGESVGSQSDFAIFSFQAIKHMTTVDGGILRVKDNELVGRAKKMRWFGMLKGVPRTEVDIDEIGYKYNMSNVNAVIGLVQLESIKAEIERHVENGRYFDRVLKNVPGLNVVELADSLQPSYWIYTLLCDDSGAVERKLIQNGVYASKLHRPNNRHSIMRLDDKLLPGLSEFYRKLLHIPCGWWVTDEDRKKIVELIAGG